MVYLQIITSIQLQCLYGSRYYTIRDDTLLYSWFPVKKTNLAKSSICFCWLQSPQLCHHWSQYPTEALCLVTLNLQYLKTPRYMQTTGDSGPTFQCVVLIGMHTASWRLQITHIITENGHNYPNNAHMHTWYLETPSNCHLQPWSDARWKTKWLDKMGNLRPALRRLTDDMHQTLVLGAHWNV